MAMKALGLLMLYLLQVTAIQNVVLNSTLNDVKIAYSGQRIKFTCTTRGSEILQWISEEFIGGGDSRLELFSSGSVDHVSSKIDPNTYARRISHSNGGSDPIITSELYLVASVQHPRTTITCDDNGHGNSRSITFEIIPMPAEDVTLTSTLDERSVAYPGQRIIFRCVTVNSEILQWRSNLYIGTGDNRLELFSNGEDNFEPSNANQHTFAMRLNTTSNNEPPVIVSELHLTASLQYPTATITCENNGHGRSQAITFHTSRRPQPSSATTLTPSTAVSSDDADTFQIGGSPSVSVGTYVTTGVGIISVIITGI